MSDLLPGTVTAAFGRHYEVQLADQRRLNCFPRAKKSAVACGDRVLVRDNGGGLGVIAEIQARHTLLYRSDAYRQKLIAANADQILLVVATDPAFSDLLISRCLVAAEHQRMKTVILLNKVDLEDKLDQARARLHQFSGAGYEVVEGCALKGVGAIVDRLHGHTTVLVGQSGMGKSTLINSLAPGAAAATGETSRALASGRHTTTLTRWYAIDARSAVIDSPGMQEFGLAHVDLEEVQRGFVDFRNALGQCRFRNCRHDTEPDCAVRSAVGRGEIAATRLKHFLQIVAEREREQSY